jgi:hypothetical protein
MEIGSKGPEFVPFQKIPRLKRGCVITEKIDGTNAQVYIGEDGFVMAGSRNRWLTPASDNFGFARWVEEHAEELAKLGPGRHYGEWYGLGIQRGYGLDHKRFALFNVGRWEGQELPACVGLVPKLYAGDFATDAVERALDALRLGGSVAAPGFMRPEGVCVYHAAAGTLYKVTLEKDEEPKGARGGV